MKSKDIFDDDSLNQPKKQAIDANVFRDLGFIVCKLNHKIQLRKTHLDDVLTRKRNYGDSIQSYVSGLDARSVELTLGEINLPDEIKEQNFETLEEEINYIIKCLSEDNHAYKCLGVYRLLQIFKTEETVTENATKCFEKGLFPLLVKGFNGANKKLKLSILRVFISFSYNHCLERVFSQNEIALILDTIHEYMFEDDYYHLISLLNLFGNICFNDRPDMFTLNEEGVIALESKRSIINSIIDYISKLYNTSNSCFNEYQMSSCMYALASVADTPIIFQEDKALTILNIFIEMIKSKRKEILQEVLWGINSLMVYDKSLNYKFNFFKTLILSINFETTFFKNQEFRLLFKEVHFIRMPFIRILGQLMFIPTICRDLYNQNVLDFFNFVFNVRILEEKHEEWFTEPLWAFNNFVQDSKDYLISASKSSNVLESIILLGLKYKHIKSITNEVSIIFFNAFSKLDALHGMKLLKHGFVSKYLKELLEDAKNLDNGILMMVLKSIYAILAYGQCFARYDLDNPNVKLFEEIDAFKNLEKIRELIKLSEENEYYLSAILEDFYDKNSEEVVYN